MKLNLFCTVKKYVDRIDRMGLLDMGAPQDEYDIESRMISERITEDKTADEIARIMAEVFAKMFMLTNEDAERYAHAAELIYEEIHG